MNTLVSRTSIRIGLCFYAIISLIACTPTVNVVTKSAAGASMSISATIDVNPDSAGRPSPLVLRIYELSAVGAFQNSSFFPIYEDDAAVLGRDLISQESLTIKPLDLKKHTIALDKDTRFIGVIAAFSSIDNAQWKTVVSIDQNTTNDLTIKAEKLAITIVRQ